MSRKSTNTRTQGLLECLSKWNLATYRMKKRKNNMLLYEGQVWRLTFRKSPVTPFFCMVWLLLISIFVINFTREFTTVRFVGFGSDAIWKSKTHIFPKCGLMVIFYGRKNTKKNHLKRDKSPSRIIEKKPVPTWALRLLEISMTRLWGAWFHGLWNNP